MKLYQITDDILAIQRQLEDDEITAEQAADLIECVTGAWTEKAASVAAVILNLEADYQAMMDAGERIYNRADRLADRIMGLRHYLLDQMQATGSTSFATAEFQVGRRQNPTSVEILDRSGVPANLERTPEPKPPPAAVPDKKAIKAYLQELDNTGEACAFARLVQTERLEIK